MRLSNPATAFTSTLTQVANFGTDDAVYFFCPDKSVPADDPCDATSDAVTENKLTGSAQNTIALCDRFFDGATLAADTVAYQAAVTKGGATTVQFPSPRSKGESTEFTPSGCTDWALQVL